MTLGIVTSRTVRSYSRRPPWPYTVNWDSPQADGLFRWFPGDPANQFTFYDLVRGSPGTINNVPALISEVNYGVVLNGNTVNNYIQFAATGFSSPASVFCWWNPVDLTATDRRLWSSRNGAGGTGPVHQNGTALEVFDGASFLSTVTGLTLSWQHIGCVYLGNNATGYRNGIPGSTVVSNGVTFWQSAAWTFGSPYVDSGPFGTYWGAGLTDLRIYQRAIPAAVVMSMYEPPTRWDLYYQPGLRSWLLPSPATPAVAGTFNAALLSCNKLLGGGIC